MKKGDYIRVLAQEVSIPHIPGKVLRGKVHDVYEVRYIYNHDESYLVYEIIFDDGNVIEIDEDDLEKLTKFR